MRKVVVSLLVLALTLACYRAAVVAPVEQAAGGKEYSDLGAVWLWGATRTTTRASECTHGVAHYSSMKIAWSWQAAQNAIVTIAHLLGLVRAREVNDWMNPEGNARRDDAIYRKAKEVLQAHVWPQETGLFKALDELEREPFYSRIPLRSGLLALGARMLLHQYVCAIVDVMRRLHGNTPYTYELCLARRPLDWQEAMLFKTTPRILSAPEIEHALLVQKRVARLRKRWITKLRPKNAGRG